MPDWLVGGLFGFALGVLYMVCWQALIASKLKKSQQGPVAIFDPDRTGEVTEVRRVLRDPDDPARSITREH